jgi:hypothetical protein
MRLPFPSRVFEILVCATTAALKQSNKPNVRRALVIALIPKLRASFNEYSTNTFWMCSHFAGISCFVIIVPLHCLILQRLRRYFRTLWETMSTGGVPLGTAMMRYYGANAKSQLKSVAPLFGLRTLPGEQA